MFEWIARRFFFYLFITNNKCWPANERKKIIINHRRRFSFGIPIGTKALYYHCYVIILF